MTHENSRNINHPAIRIRNRYRLRKRFQPALFPSFVELPVGQTAYVRPKLLFVGSLAVKGQGKLYTTRKSFASFWQMYVAGRTVSWELLLLPISWIIIIFLFEVFVYR